jgi:uncharacterized protein YdeI (BOF family)
MLLRPYETRSGRVVFKESSGILEITESYDRCILKREVYLVADRPEDRVTARTEWEYGLVHLRGHISVKEDIKIGVNGTLIIDPGTVIDLSSGADIVIDGGGLYINGSKEEPVIIQGGNNGSVMISNANEVRISNTRFDSLNTCCGTERWTTGGLTLFRTSAHLTEIGVANFLREDALHIAESVADIQSLSVSNTYSDALDADNSSVTIDGGTVVSVGGDGFDFFHSTGTIQSVILDGIKDKGFSIGERSIVSVSESVVSDSGVALAVKDGSAAELNKFDCISPHYACLLTYRKKKIFGRSVINFKSGDVGKRNFHTKHGVFKGNISKTKIKETEVDELYKSGFMKKIR